MQTLLITPLFDELTPLLQAFCRMGYAPLETRAGNLVVHAIRELDLLMAQGGHGKTQFGIQAQHLLDQIPGIALVICAGAAGGIAPSVAIGDLVVATCTVEHDFNERFVPRPLPAFDGSPAHLQRIRSLLPLSEAYKIHLGSVASGDEDVIERQRAEALLAATGALAVAWEGAGGARTAKFMGIPFIEIRGLTDIADNEAPAIFDENVRLIMPRIADIVERLQKSINAMPLR